MLAMSADQGPVSGDFDSGDCKGRNWMERERLTLAEEDEAVEVEEICVFEEEDAFRGGRGFWVLGGERSAWRD